MFFLAVTHFCIMCEEDFFLTLNPESVPQENGAWQSLGVSLGNISKSRNVHGRLSFVSPHSI